MAIRLAGRLLAPLSSAGLVIGAVAFLAALTPSLIPRPAMLQGAVAGLAFGIGYLLGTAAAQLWQWLGLWHPRKPVAGILRLAAIAIALALVAAGLFFAADWQQMIHDALRLPPVQKFQTLILGLVSLTLIAVLILAGRLFLIVKDTYLSGFRRLLPPRLAFLLAILLASWTFWAVGNGVLLASIFSALDSSYRTIDEFRDADTAPPVDPLKSGSAQSLLSWNGLGAEGRNRVLSGPSRDEIAELAGGDVMEPLRVYVGANSADTVEDRAQLALAELIRVGGFDRSLLVIATPTGTGWVDPAAMMPLEILHRGDVATVSVQYSYLPSWMSLLVHPQYGQDTTAAVFEAVYGHWRNLPRDRRPRLYLFGLSLGALNSDLASDALDILGDPYHGAFWVGPPFDSRTWRDVTASRRAGSPPWLPEPRNPALFRFMSNADASQLGVEGWGATRFLYLQYPSDPITFFERDSWRRQPAWMDTPRGPDVPKQLAWVPVVTFLQLVFDMMTATTVPKGGGHVFAASHYLEGWRALTEPQGWTDADLDKVKAWLDARGL